MSIEQIRHTSTVIGLEAISGDNAFRKALSRLPGFLVGVRKMFSQPLQLVTVGNRPVVNFHHGSAAKLSAADYARHRNTIVQIPEGLKVDLLTYSKALLAATERMAPFHDQMAEPLMRWINYTLSSPSSMGALSNTLTIQGHAVVDLGDVQKDIVNCFETRGQLQSEVPYGKALKRNADWADIDTNFLTMTAALGPAFHKKMATTLKELEISVDTLYTRVVNNPEKYQMTPNLLKQLVEEVVQVAEGFDFYAQLCYRIQEFDHSCERIQVATVGKQ